MGATQRNTATEGNESHRRSSARIQLVRGAVVLLLAYVLSASLCFDPTTAAVPYDEDNDAMGNPVAFGPRPYSWVCVPRSLHGFYAGDEWVFHVYAPLCWWWRTMLGYVRPRGA